MLGQCSTGGVSELNNRIFVYEVTGLSQNEMTIRSQSPIRTSHSQFFQVPFSRMSQEMQRILRLGGEIVNIQPLSIQNAATEVSESEEEEKD
ncbi:MAG: phycobilisome linker polypeptide [Phormidesmis sp.]